MRTRLLPLLLICTLVLAGALAPVQAQDDVISIRFLNTADEHGWLESFTPFGSEDVLGGAANVYSWWLETGDYDPANTLILSSGDNWTGPALSTWFQGEPTVQAFNRMGYTATAIGNHEFDFGRDILNQRIAESDYAYLGANIRYASSGELADFVQPYLITEISGVRVGIIGLATTKTATTTHPANIGDLTFAGYAPTLEYYVPEMRAAGADVVVVLAHVCVTDLANLAFEVGDLVDAMFGGHCNAFAAAEVNGIPVVGSGWAWRSYARLDLEYNPATGDIEGYDHALVEVIYPASGENPVTPDAELEALIAGWQAQVDDVLSEEIGYTATGIERQSPPMVNALTDSWLLAYPAADVAITNFGGFRQDIAAGPVTVGTIVDVLPFENRIYEVAITGEELVQNLLCCGGAVSGIRYTRTGRGVTITFDDGREFDPAATYRVLVNDFMYFGGSDYLFGQQDPDGYDTGIQWRQPLIDWLREHPTSPDNPLEDLLDPVSRGW